MRMLMGIHETMQASISTFSRVCFYIVCEVSLSWFIRYEWIADAIWPDSFTFRDSGVVLISMEQYILSVYQDDSLHVKAN